MGREWKPGDVAVLTTPDGREFMAVRTEGGSTGDYWSAPKGWPRGSVSDYECAIRPLVVIDPEDREQIERLADLYWAGRICDMTNADAMQAALREFANPTPPKPDEPLGLGAVVEDEQGGVFVRWSRQHRSGRVWKLVDEPGEYRHYADIAAVRVLSPGWTEGEAAE